MTEVTFTTNANNMIIGFNCNGHSGYAKRGKDIVCASISVLMFNTINTLTELIGAEVKLDVDDTKAISSCFLNNEPTEKTELIMRSFEMGIKGIHESYGSKFCKVTYKED